MKTALAILFIALVLVVGTIEAAAVPMEGQQLLSTESTLGRKAEAGCGTITTVGNKSSADNTDNEEANSDANAASNNDNEKNESHRETQPDSDGESHHQYSSVNPPKNGGDD